MHDILPQEYIIYKHIYEKAEEIASYYGFMNIATPYLEKKDLFTASLGDSSDIVEKQMYNLKTKGGDILTLRPEGTAPIMRSYIENGMQTWPQPVMFQYQGSFFRHEKPQRGRLREFHQFGLEILGEEKAIAEAMIIKILFLALGEIGIKNVMVHINSLGDKGCRNAFRKELVNYYRKKINSACGDCKKRFYKNPLRLLDCKEEKCIEIKNEAPQMIDFMCAECKRHFKEVLEFLDTNEIPYSLNTRLVRGLDYYSRTVFEFIEETENEINQANFALGGGGRYDYLSQMLSNKKIPAVGGALGVDRIAQLISERQIKIKSSKETKIFFIQLGSMAKYKSLKIIEMLRKNHIPLMQSVSKDTLKSQLRIASRLNMSYALILGQKEVMEKSIIVKNMETSAQETVPIEKVVEFVKNKLKQND